ncbi:type II secretion system minor pseudopilin GspK [Thioalkalivibrio sp. ALE11]|uniref:type II secretion system minor pseudopilin GspK n=1 Tax=Thioalkalivibrio sp. ALE11 TaxID=1265494 RepID=UPI0003809774|nr:type II secretion system minor pseudopilin GspK [Thioalkalivibrio sp. ALE11]
MIRPGPRRQSGAALITALLVVAIATVTATTMALRDQQQIHRATLLQEQDRARQLTRGAEAVARHLLEEQRDLTELPWEGCQSPPIPIEIDGLTVTGRLDNLHCRFNINSLSRAEDPPLGAFATLVEEVLADTEGSGTSGRRVAMAVHDWMNPETDDPVYRGLEPPRLSGNRPMRVASELLQVEGVDNELWQALAPQVAALPSSDNRVDPENAPEAVRRAVEADAAAPDTRDGESRGPRYFRLQLVVRTGGREYFHCAVIDAPNGQTVLRERTPCEP